MKIDIANVRSWRDRHAERLDSPIKVLVIQRILIVPDSGRWVRYLVAHKPDAIVTWVWLSLAHDGS